jgi:tetratricopeptide (TPR) repeat protein
MKKWSIPTDQLTRARGSIPSRRGYTFQDAYACIQLIRLLDDSQGVISVRPEGAEDVDLLYRNGREEYIQLKNEPNKHYTLVTLRPILQSFAVNLLKAGRASTVTFTLIARSNYVNQAVIRLLERNPWPDDIGKVSQLLAQSIRSSPAPQCLIKLSDAERRGLVGQLLQQTKFSFGKGDEINGRLSFDSHACTELLKYGIAGTEVHDALNTLKAALGMQKEFTRADVEELLKPFIGGAAIDVFEGRVEALTDELLSHPASPDRIHQFYKGAPLYWDIIAAHGDIERDQQEDLIRQLKQPPETFRVVCVVAEPGAGKSTLAWRVAAELHRRHNAFIIRVRDKEDAGVWYLMREFCQKVKHPVYVLADDLFRDPDVVGAIRELDSSLPITILATSRSNEYRPNRLRVEIQRVSLKEPSRSEKEQILMRLGKTRDGLAPEQQRRLDAANQFLVLMIELTDPQGRKLEEIFRETIEWLKINDEYVYRAYEYLCFAYQHSLSIPSSLLGRLDAQGHFFNLHDRDTAQGLIFYDEDRTGNVRVGHPIVAAISSVLYEKTHRDPALVLSEIMGAADTSNHLERRFVAHLLRVVAQTKSSALRSALPRIEAAIASCKQNATITELSIWRTFYLNLGLHERAEECVDAALTAAPVSSVECNRLVNLCRERGRERDALPAIAKYVHEHPKLCGARPTYLNLVERYGTRNEIEEALKETSMWLEGQPEDANVRCAYLGFVEGRGTAEQVERVLWETSTWLREHPWDTHVRGAYLGSVERQGTAEQVERVLRETSKWLGEHPEDAHVRGAYLGLVERQGTAELVERVLRETSKWLGEHPEDAHVRGAYLGLVERQGTAKQVERVLQETSKWLKDHPEDNYVRGAYLGLVEEQGTAEQVERVLRETSKWLKDHPEDNSVRGAYLGLVERQGTEKQVERVLRETSKWLKDHPEDNYVRCAFITLVESRGSDKLKGAMLHDTRVWLSLHTAAKEVWLTLIATLVRMGRQQEAVETAVEAIYHHPDDPGLTTHYLHSIQESADEQTVRNLYKSLITRHPGDPCIRIEFAAWLRDHNFYDEAEHIYKELIRLPQSKTTPWQRRETYYGNGLLLLKLDRYDEAEKQFRQTLSTHKGHQMAREGLARAMHGLGKFAEQEGKMADASRYFAEAEKEFRQAIYWGGVQGQPQAIFYTSLGWFYIDRQRYNDALEAFYSAIDENPEYFGNYWGLGRARMSLGEIQEAEDALRIALDKAPKGLQPPASNEIPELLRQCQDALNPNNNIT